MNYERVYLDYNATAPLRTEALAAIETGLSVVGNPSSVHAEGRAARAIVETARAQVAAAVGVAAKRIIFTSGASESNTWVLKNGRWSRIIVSAVEHDSVLAPARASDCELAVARVDADGVVDLCELERLLAIKKTHLQGSRGGPVLVSLQAANGETGVCQPIDEVIALARDYGAVVHVDAVQLLGKAAWSDALGEADALSLSAHKIGGPKGVGALIANDRMDLSPYIHGGGQEQRKRAGTENVAGIAGFGAACAAIVRCQAEERARIERLRDELEQRVKDVTPDICVLSPGAMRLPNTSCIAMRETKAETVVMALDLEGIAVSAGSACSSGKVGRSHVLEAMGLEDQLAGSAIRISLGWASTREDVEKFLFAWGCVMQRLATRTSAERKIA